MYIDIETLTIFKYLHSLNPVYYGKALDLRGHVEDWLSYIPQTFPHYTRHTIKHSDEILLQVSKILFRNNDEMQPAIRLASIEVYIIIVCAYMHDAGMVVSDLDKLDIIKSDEWNHWISNGGGSKRWIEINNFRKADSPLDETIRNFIADFHIRFLIAEFVRSRHHYRSKEFISQQKEFLSDFYFNDSMLLKTINDICTAHGLSICQLNEDKSRYPDQRDIQGNIVNVHLLAILLRIGDLLDLSSDRACPLLLNAACPLPPESIAHWSQFQRITHRLTTPERIEITAECNTQDEHQLLTDWCQWLVDEIRNAEVVVHHWRIYSTWKPPVINFNGKEQTIKIGPSKLARYKPCKWQFILDHDIIFERLIHDINAHGYSFVRELIQNSLDATRCQLELDFKTKGICFPEYPTKVDSSICHKYPIIISLEYTTIYNQFSQENEQRPILILEDYGIGMDEEIITKYLLQVGRSYYKTEAFKKSFSFIPTSQFGIGFLSVFTASERVTISTFKPSSNQAEPINITLTGPKNYLLVEKGTRIRNGTKIEVILKETVKLEKIKEYLADICKRVEFPIIVNYDSEQLEITAEKEENFIYCEENVIRKNTKYGVKAFPINIKGIEGEVYTFFSDENGCESWDLLKWYQEKYPYLHPNAQKPLMPSDLICYHGINISRFSYFYSFNGFSFRLDCRNNVIKIGIVRDMNIEDTDEFQSLLSIEIQKILTKHLETTKRKDYADAWAYKQRLINLNSNELLIPFWEKAPQTIRVFLKGEQDLLSLKQLTELPIFFTLFSLSEYNSYFYLYYVDLDIRENLLKEIEEIDIHPTEGIENYVLIDKDLEFLSDVFINKIFQNRVVSSISLIEKKYLAIEWVLLSDIDNKTISIDNTCYYFFKHPNEKYFGTDIHKVSRKFYDSSILNINHPITKWLITLIEYNNKNNDERIKNVINTILKLIQEDLKPYKKENKLIDYIKKIKITEDWPSHLYPNIPDDNALLLLPSEEN